MEPLQLLVVSLKGKSQTLIENSLAEANYSFKITHADSKQNALQACGEKKFDILISNCKLSDGPVTDLVSVLGDLLPCLVMAEGKCPFTAESILFIPETNYYISCSEQISWLTHLENTMAIWENAAKERIALFNQNYNNLFERALLRCAEELSPANESTENAVLNTLDLLREVLDISRVYICRKYGAANHVTEIVQTLEVCAPGVASKNRKNSNTDYPYYKSWDSSFSAQKPVQIKYSALEADQKSWWQTRDMQSFLAIPISYKESWDGFIGFEDSMHPRDWSNSEISFLKSVSELIHEKHMHFHISPVFLKNNS
ncbi:GAF domain-containing protein [Dyadobacter frigoris]|uniref:GAF domain-containing protein n=1 Tax=Dyadobacter frigoris TaxID=2576211 RepID=A0A4U6D792_9BACT|nr:GAF domain-containing protein [Dyadobacter frigoris]TKT92365.1 GAF domain-containing protein [Dyadobacter frigoris]GLU53553.1 hypothetical protein Dfri01_30140 [Dyadobacter frigoris]